MSEIKCPHCGQMFAIDESDYTALLKQVRDEEFQRELKRQETSLIQANEAHIKALLAENTAENLKVLGAKESELATLQARLKSITDEQALKAAELKSEFTTALAEKDAQNARLQAQMETFRAQAETQLELAVQKSLSDAAEQRRGVEQERDELKLQLEREQFERERIETTHATELSIQLRAKDDIIATREREIDDMRRMRTELSVKMIGESLEQFCENEFNKLRATGFQSALFQKDNDASEGSKGDYIYRELDEAGNEIVSIMFEMKNEAEESAHKKRNEDHFKKLDHDRRSKACEYAVLVSLLERDNDYYNTGIVDVSYASGYEKMYVIRPQFFIPLITLIRNAALKSQDLRNELLSVRRQNVDVTHFEEQLETFKAGFGRNCELAQSKFQDAIKDIEATIKKLEKIKEELTSSDRNLRLANNKLTDITIKRLTRNNPTMKAAFAAASQQSGEADQQGDESDKRLSRVEIFEDEWYDDDEA